jgi:hypothetical protein
MQYIPPVQANQFERETAKPIAGKDSLVHPTANKSALGWMRAFGTRREE